MLGQDGKIDTEIVFLNINKKVPNANDLKSASAITNDINKSILEHYEMWLRENEVSFQSTFLQGFNCRRQGCHFLSMLFIDIIFNTLYNGGKNKIYIYI